MEINDYSEFKKENEEVTSVNQVREKFDVDEYEATNKKYKTGFIVSLIATILVFVVDVACLVHIFVSGKPFTGLDFFYTIGLFVFDILGVVFTFRCYNRWKEYE